MLPRVEDVLLRLGDPGLALPMLVESVFPPIPSELVYVLRVVRLHRGARR